MGSVGLAAIAGCSGSDTDASSEGDGGASETTATATRTAQRQSEPEQEQTVASGPLDPPPGTSEDGIDDPTTLIEATREGLRANGYVIENQFIDSDGQTSVLRTRSDPEQQQYRSLFDGPSNTVREYVGDGTFYVKLTSDEGTQYGGGYRIESFATYHEENDHIQNYVTQSNLLVLEGTMYTPGETITRDQRRLLQFDGASRSDGESAGGVVDSETYLYVSAESRVFESAFAIEDADGETTTDYSFDIEEFGDVTVTEPDWVATARQRTQ